MLEGYLALFYRSRMSPFPTPLRHLPSISTERHMSREGLHEKVESLLSLADVEIGSVRPWDIRVHDDRFYERVHKR